MIPSLAGVGIVVPIRDEEELLGPSLRALATAMEHAGRQGAAVVEAVVVLDGCVDRSRDVATAVAAEITRRPGLRVAVVEMEAGNVGRARRLGVRRLLSDLRPLGSPRIWLATTDGDSRVPPSWLTHQLAQRARGVDAWAGTVVVESWAGRAERLAAGFAERYWCSPTGHVHGASMGFSADAYLRAGGFPPMETAEDHGLWRRLGLVGARRVHDPDCPVVTSARRRGRAPAGFAGALDQLERQLEGTTKMLPAPDHPLAADPLAGRPLAPDTVAAGPVAAGPAAAGPAADPAPVPLPAGPARLAARTGGRQ